MEGGQQAGRVDGGALREPTAEATARPEPAPLVSASASTSTGERTDPSPSEPPTERAARSVFDPRPAGPTLPNVAAKAPPPMVDQVVRPRPSATTWYRSDEERNKSVYRRANPWYRRLARGVIGLTFLAAAAVGLYGGALALQSYLDRDQLPASGAEVPAIRATSFIVTSEAPAPALDGTLTIDTVTGAFEFVGRATGPQSGLQVVSADGATAYVRQGAGPWRAATPTDALVDDVHVAVAYLADDATADAILTNRLRRGFVDLVAVAEEGTGDELLTRYEMTFDTASLARDYPLQWQEYREGAVPGAQEAATVAVSIWTDSEEVLVRVRDDGANWAWERLTYTDQPFTPVDPSADAGTQVVQVACVSADGAVFWQTPFRSCDEAMATAREAAAAAGLTAAFDDLDRRVAQLCASMEREEAPVPATADDVALAAVLVEAGVCRGDPTIVTLG